MKHLYQNCPCTLCYPGWPAYCDRCLVQKGKEGPIQILAGVLGLIVLLCASPLYFEIRHPSELYPIGICLGALSTICGALMIIASLIPVITRYSRYRQAGLDWRTMPKRLSKIGR